MLILAPLNNIVFTEHKSGPTVSRFLISNRITPEISSVPSRQIGEDKWEKYEGKVYCATVSTGFMLVRRNGKPVVCGNTPFERGIVEFNIICDTASHIHCIKHRLANINGESARYRELKDDKYHIPEDWGNIIATNLTGPILEKHNGKLWREILKTHTEISDHLYHSALSDLEKTLGRKRAKESARFFKTYNSQVTLSVMMNMSCFHNFYCLRADQSAQLEIREIAQQMLDLVKTIPGEPFKFTLEAFGL